MEKKSIFWSCVESDSLIQEINNLQFWKIMYFYKKFRCSISDKHIVNKKFEKCIQF